MNGTFDCIINLGCNIYHLKEHELLRALIAMKEKLKPGGLLLIDNKKWFELLSVSNGKKRCILIEKRPIVRIFNSKPLNFPDGESYYFIDIARYEVDQWVIEVIRLPAKNIQNFIKTEKAAFLEIDDNPRAMVVALFYSGGNVKVSERQAFLDGFGTSTQNERLIVESYPRLDSLRDVNIMLSELSDRDVSIFFISMSALNKEIITTIAAQFTSMVISEKFGGIVSFSDRILATIEEPWAEGVVALAAGTAQTLTPNAVLMPGPALDDPKKDWISAPESR